MLKGAAWGLAALVAVTGVAGYCAAAEVQQAIVGHKGSRYHLDLRMRLEIPAGAAWQVFTDFAALRELNPIITEVHATRIAADRFEVDATVHACVLVFCRSVRQLQDVRLYPQAQGGVIDGRVVPAHSDFSYGIQRWDIAPCSAEAQTTCLRFVADLEPKFWIPPWIGSVLVEHKMRKEAETVARNVELKVLRNRQAAQP
ncbi:MAG: hypothetical protein EPN72_11425 [Nevskiaceae bacterium]|nr:MAG: hypothetical protein EPN63_01555 [Nevskiaceae bacterium]TBR71807.1 MAG: hypothetical protein EPN72_11425 [Nevskiaceae bacterium]